MPLPDIIILQYLSQKPQRATSLRILITSLMLSFLWLCLKRSWFLKRRKALRKIGIIVIFPVLKISFRNQILVSYLSALLLILLYSPVILFAFVHCRSLLAQLSPANVSVYTRMCDILETPPLATHTSLCVRAWPESEWVGINKTSEGSFGLVETAMGKSLFDFYHRDDSREVTANEGQKRDLWLYSNWRRWGLWSTPSCPHRPEEYYRKH